MNIKFVFFENIFVFYKLSIPTKNVFATPFGSRPGL